ncbi:MAG: helicase [Ruminococcus sp.]|nr:helicase [Ruminococcus sp.]
MGNGTADSQEHGRSGRSDRGYEKYGHDVLGRDDEQLQAGSIGDNNQGTDRNLNENGEAVSSENDAAFSSVGTQFTLFETSENENTDGKSLSYYDEDFIDSIIEDEICTGMPFALGKYDVDKFYHDNKPSESEFAGYLKKLYGSGGHSGQGAVNWVFYDKKGYNIELTTKYGNKNIHQTWSELARRTAALIDANKYISSSDRQSLLKNAKFILAYGDEEKHSERIDKAKEIISYFSGSTEKISTFRAGEADTEERGAKSRFKANIEAIKTLKITENASRRATPEEQAVMAKYSGWGGLHQAFDPDNDKWEKEFETLRNLLTIDEYDAARASTLTAYYTDTEIISAMYTNLRKNGFTGGKILDPAMGTGRFFAAMPQEMMDKSELHGVEIDSITGRISQKLYPEANVIVDGFEKTVYNDDAFDLAVGNIPFADYKLPEDRYDKYNFRIHDHFFAKALDKVKPGGVVAFITSTGTLDKKNDKTRKYIAQRAELIGAIRLPNNAFTGTEVTSDIVFLQKRKEMISEADLPDWVNTVKTDEGFTINSYFQQNPDMVLGKLVPGNKLYGSSDSCMCEPIPNRKLSTLLEIALSKVRFTVSEKSTRNVLPEISDIAKDERKFSYISIGDKLYYNSDKGPEAYEGSLVNAKRIIAMTQIRDTLRLLIKQQTDNLPDDIVKRSQEHLSSLYDDFVSKYGYISSKENHKLFCEDVSYPLICSLEHEKNGKIEKADIFYRRTINPDIQITHTNTAVEALAVSIAKRGYVDIEFMSQLTGKSDEKVIDELHGVVFENPVTKAYETADEYLSGNIREKLDYLIENYPDASKYAVNIEALKAAMPKKLEAGDIDVRLGATWIDPEYVQKFMNETFHIPYYLQRNITVQYSAYTAEWKIDGKSVYNNNVITTDKFGVAGVRNAYQLLEDSLNLKHTIVKDKIERDGKETYVINPRATELAQEKQKMLQNEFKSWIFKEPDRRNDLVEKYNRLFNSRKPREYDGSHIEFVGMNNEIKLREHQKNAVAHALYGGNTLFAHEVGAGKTYEMIATAMEGKRLGLHHKSLIVVPNHLTEQMGKDFMQLYPNANILVAGAKDFTKQNRQKLFAKISTGDMDAIIIGHSQLIKIPVSKERQMKCINEQINEIVESISEIKRQNGDTFQVKQMEKAKIRLQNDLQSLTNKPVRDDVIDFEELGVDKLFVDEAHYFKNLFLATKMGNISGISSNKDVQKTADLYMKCQYLDEITGGKGVVFATGTPVSNSISEIYLMQKYLQHDLLKETGMNFFDAWAANFAQTVTENQLLPEGNGYQLKTRFANFTNLPELMCMFREVADIKTADTLNLKVPECEALTIVAKPTKTQEKLIESLGSRAKDIRLRKVLPTQDNMLNITTDGKKIGLDQRLIDPLLPDEEGSKVNMCVDNVYDIWQRTSENRSTQLIFSDLGVPQDPADEKKNGTKFCVYDDIKNKLVSRGVPAEEIAFIHNAKTDEDKAKLFAKVRTGEVRILIGSTLKMGAGTNVQNKVVASHDLDVPCKPADMEQRRGRMVRQGNENEKVQLFRYVTEGTFDAYMYQMLENKQKFISQIMTSKSPVRSCEDVDDVTLSYAEIKALSAGNPLIKEKMDLDVEVTKLKMLKANHDNLQFKLEDNIVKIFPKQISRLEARIEKINDDIKHINTMSGEEFPGIKIGDKFIADKSEAGEEMLNAIRKASVGGGYNNIAEYKGFEIAVAFDTLSQKYIGQIKNNETYRIEFGSSGSGNITRLDNLLNPDALSKMCDQTLENLSEVRKQFEDAKSECGKPFVHEKELYEKSARLAELTEMLDINANAELEQTRVSDPYYMELNDCEIAMLEQSNIKHEVSDAASADVKVVKIEREDKARVKELISNNQGLKK